MGEDRQKHTWEELTQAAYKSIDSKTRAAVGTALAFMALINPLTDIFIYGYSDFLSILKVIQLVGIYGCFKFMLWAALPNTKGYRRVSTLAAIGIGIKVFDLLIIKGSSLQVVNAVIGGFCFIVGICMIPVMLSHMLFVVVEKLDGGSKLGNGSEG
jgi:hypothetical protein